MANSKKHKRKGLYGTLLLHALLMLSFMFLGLTYTIPPPPEEGININFGFNDFGIGDIQPEEVVEELQESVESAEEVNTPVDIETPTQSIEDAPTFETDEEAEEDPQPEVDTKSLYPGKKDPSKSEGERIGKRDQGKPNAIKHNARITGTNFIKRTNADTIIPIYENQAQGIVVVKIRVDRYGKVIYATPGVKGSTTTDTYLYKRAKEAAEQTTFDADPDAPEERIGRISYDFVLE